MAKKEKVEKIATEEVVEKNIDPKLEEAINFIESVKGQSRLTSDQAKYMFNLYNSIFNRNEHNYTCDSCAINIYQKIKEFANV